MYTLLLDTINDYRSKYKDGMKLLSQKKHKITIEKTSFDLVLEDYFHESYDLHFDSRGLLNESLHYENYATYKINYYYNGQDLLLLAICSNPKNYKLKSISEFSYDNKGRIEIETIRYFSSFSDYISTEQYIHTYTDNKEVIVKLGINEDEEFIFYNTYDLKQRLIESIVIRDDEEVMYWYKNEYNNSGELIKTIDFDDAGNQIDMNEYYEFRDGLRLVHLRKSKESSSVNEFHYITDEKGNWTNRVNIFDGEPEYVYKRKIEYY